MCVYDAYYRYIVVVKRLVVSFLWVPYTCDTLKMWQYNTDPSANNNNFINQQQQKNGNGQNI